MKRLVFTRIRNISFKVKEALQTECSTELIGRGLGGGKIEFLSHGPPFPMTCDDVGVGWGETGLGKEEI